MPAVDLVVECPVYRSFRVEQLAGMFDVPIEERARERFRVELPDEDEDWQIGLITGPSGSGKTTVARAAFGDRVYRRGRWPKEKAVVDGFGERSIREITSTLTSVGFSSPPSWLKPYAALSNGEQFRCDLARALLGRGALVVFDEFTSVVDRTVAKIGSAAVARAIRKGQVAKRFVAVTCHYDVAEWLEPDWVLDMADGTLARRRLRRPQIRIEIHRCRQRLWQLFRRHHYLSGSLSKGATCFVALWDRRPVAFCAVVSLIGRKNRYRISRIVVLPDFQGVGVGVRVMEAIAERYVSQGKRMNITASHPAVLSHCRRSPRWRLVNVRRVGSRKSNFVANYRDASRRSVVSFEYVGKIERAGYGL